jgi:hypothetical protein
MTRRKASGRRCGARIAPIGGLARAAVVVPGGFEFVHDVRRRGMALPESSLGRLVAPPESRMNYYCLSFSIGIDGV